MASQVNSEFYTGWLDHWGDRHAAVDSGKVSRVLEEMLVMGASVNMYVSSTVVTATKSAGSSVSPSANPVTRLKLIANIFLIDS